MCLVSCGRKNSRRWAKIKSRTILYLNYFTMTLKFLLQFKEIKSGNDSQCLIDLLNVTKTIWSAIYKLKLTKKALRNIHIKILVNYVLSKNNTF